LYCAYKNKLLFFKSQNELFEEKPLLVPLYPPQIPNKLDKNRTRAPAMRDFFQEDLLAG